MSACFSHEDRLDAFFACLSEELTDVRTTREEVSFACERQMQRMRKRAAYRRPYLKQQAVDAFMAINDAVANVRVDLDRELVANARHFITVVLERFATRHDPTNIQVTLDPSLLFDYWRFGPGASNGIRGTHAAEKISQAMTCTIPSAPLVSRIRKMSPYFQLFDQRNGNNGITLLRGSRLTTVPKNEDTERTIAIEPSGNMALQLAAGRYLENVLRSIGLDITCQQPKNKAMALSGSIDGGIATIDLKSASDMISIALVRALLPPDWFDLLMTIRSPEIDVPGRGWVKLNMISTMGNGFTFPLMTLILSSLIYAYRAMRDGPNLRIDWSQTCVFGDDIIVPVHEYSGICETLERAGLIVNHDKSYSAGSFRESCGGDYYKGYDVTPFYVKSLADDRSLFVALNQLVEWCGKHNLLFHRSILLLKSFFRGKIHFVPEWHGPDEGFRTASVSGRYTFLKTIIPDKVLREDDFKVMLACGGYINSRSDLDVVYQPRPFKTKAVVKKSRVPKGFTSGWDPLSRSEAISAYVESISFLLV